MDKSLPQAFSPEDMKRRKRRSIVLAVVLVLLVAMFFVSTLIRLGANIAERTM
jgi:hypothetical protein